jgi:hypothetical protein
MGLYFRSGKLLFDKFRRLSFCDKCECSKKNDIPTPCSWPTGNVLPSCVVIGRSNVLRCPECTTTASTGGMPIELYLNVHQYEVQARATPSASRTPHS